MSALLHLRLWLIMLRYVLLVYLSELSRDQVVQGGKNTLLDLKIEILQLLMAIFLGFARLDTFTSVRVMVANLFLAQPRPRNHTRRQNNLRLIRGQRLCLRLLCNSWHSWCKESCHHRHEHPRDISSHSNNSYPQIQPRAAHRPAWIGRQHRLLYRGRQFWKVSSPHLQHLVDPSYASRLL